MATKRVEDIAQLASILSGVSFDEIMGKTRGGVGVARIRQAVMLLGVEAGQSRANVGRLMGRDHSTVIYGMAQALNIASRDPEYALFLSNLRTEVEAAEPFLDGYNKQEPLPLVFIAKPKLKAKAARPSTFNARNIRDDENENSALYFARIINGSRKLADAINAERVAA